MTCFQTKSTMKAGPSYITPRLQVGRAFVNVFSTAEQNTSQISKE